MGDDLTLLEPAPDTLVRAAGGVVWRSASSGDVEVLVVHRPRYGDWSFPKGKCETGEASSVCALREVEEETGYRCLLGPELSGTAYLDAKGRHKQVRYWAMTLASGSFEANEEVDQILWLPVGEAGSRLSYDRDRSVLDSFTTGRSEPGG